MNIGIYIYDGVDPLNFAGPFDAFTTAARLCNGSQPFEVFLVGETGDEIEARAGLRVVPHYNLQNHPEMYVLIVPGGRYQDELPNETVIDWIATQAKKVSITASVCTGAFLLAEAGILDRKKATTHWNHCADLRDQYKRVEVVEDVRWVDENPVFTSGGISAGIDVSLYLISQLNSQELAETTAEHMAFPWSGP